MLKVLEYSPNLELEHYRPGILYFRIGTDFIVFMIGIGLIPLLLFHPIHYTEQQYVISIIIGIICLLLYDRVLGQKITDTHTIMFNFSEKVVTSRITRAHKIIKSHSYPLSAIVITCISNPSKIDFMMIFKVIHRETNKILFDALVERVQISLGTYNQTIHQIQAVFQNNGFKMKEQPNPLGTTYPTLFEIVYSDVPFTNMLEKNSFIIQRTRHIKNVLLSIILILFVLLILIRYFHI